MADNDGTASQLLESETTVDIVSAGRSPLEGSLPGLRIYTVLPRHDVAVNLFEMPRSRKSIGDTWIDFCGKANANLPVIGAYENSPPREGLIVCVTHSFVPLARLTVLMSH